MRHDPPACRPAAGYSVIPLAPNSKRPALPSWAEYQARRPTEEEVRSWWSEDPARNVGIVCGGVSGALAVLDIDRPDLAQQVLDDLGLQAQRVPAVRTPRGGLHLYVRQPEAVSRSGPLASRVDFKGEGGYVAAPPSIVDGKLYVTVRKGRPLEVPDARAWAVETMRAFGVDVPGDNGHRPAYEALAEPLTEGRRNVVLTSLAGTLPRRGLDPATIEVTLLAVNRERCEPPLPETEIAGISRSISHYQPTYTAYKAVEVGQPLPLLSLGDLRRRHNGRVDWIVEGYFARREVGFLAGPGESFKSWMAAHFAAAVDGRFPWLSVFPVAAERVLYVEQERAGNLIYQLNRIEVAERVALGSERLRIIPPATLPLSEPEAQVALEEAVVGFRPDVVVINALRDVLGRANENSPTDIATLLRPLGRLAESYHCLVLILDHFNKGGLLGLLRGNAAHAGTAQKHAEADFVMVAERPRDELGRGRGPATISVTKRRTGEAGPAFSVSVTDTDDGGVLVRAQLGVPALSARAQAVRDALTSGPLTVAEMAERTGQKKPVVHNALSELRRAGLLAGEGEPGKAHRYRLVRAEPTSTAYNAVEVGVPPPDAVVAAVESLGLLEGRL